MNILVTGAGSLIGHGILRSLREIDSNDLTIYTADPDHCAAGHWLGDYGVKIPLAKEPHYIETLSKIIDEHDINVVFIGADPELSKISGAVDQLNTTVVISSPEALRIGDDKWETVQFLKVHGFAYPNSALLDNADEVEKLVRCVGFPLIAKPRIGARSVGVFVLHRPGDLEPLKGRPGYIVQEFLSESAGEYTAGTMTYDSACYSCVIFRRDLKEGNTYRAYQFENKEHQAFLEKVSCALPGVYGPINFQYRMRDDIPVIFEINSRFSGTTPLRAAVGVNEIEMALEFIKTGRLEKRVVTIHNLAIFRTWSDIIVPIDQVNEFSKTGRLPGPSASYFPFLSK